MLANSSPLPITFCITDLDAGGAERALVEIITRLDRDRFLPRVICLSQPGVLTETLDKAGIEVTHLYASGARDLGVLFQLYRQLKLQQPVILQTFLFHANILGRLAGWAAGIPHIVGGIRVAEHRSSWYLRMDRWTERFVEKQVCVSQAVKEFSIDQGGLSESKLVVITNGVNFERYAEAEPASRTEFTWKDEHSVGLFVGRLDPQKGVDTFMEAILQLQVSHPHLRWLIVGDGPQRDQLEKFVQNHNFQELVQLTGRRDDVAALMKLADFLVLPSRWEGMPNVVLEAMAAGLPVICSQVEGTEELIEHEREGLLFPVESSDQLAERVSGLLGSPELTMAMARNAQEKVRDQFSWDTIAQAYQQLYLSLLS